MLIRRIVTAGTLFAALICGPAMASGGRVALVIGNSAYSQVAPLPNPANDARDIAAALTRLGFEVMSGNDLDARSFKDSLQNFEDRAAGAEMAIVYYAGHGIEVGGTNYLIPTDARLKRDTHIADEAIPLERVMAAVQTAKGLKLVILDACRDNPFIAKMSRAPGATRSIGRGLVRIEPENILVAYAAREGTVASDGSGRNSPYAAALLSQIEEPGLEVNKLFRRVRDKVVAATGGQQTPFVYGSIGGDDIFLKPPEVKPEQAPAPPALDIAALYTHAQGIGTVAAWDAFLETCKDSPYCKLGEAARAKLAALPEIPAPEVQPPSPIEATAPAVVEPPAKASPKKAKPVAKPKPRPPSQQATDSSPETASKPRKPQNGGTASRGNQWTHSMFPHLEKQRAEQQQKR